MNGFINCSSGFDVFRCLSQVVVEMQVDHWDVVIRINGQAQELFGLILPRGRRTSAGTCSHIIHIIHIIRIIRIIHIIHIIHITS